MTANSRTHGDSTGSVIAHSCTSTWSTAAAGVDIWPVTAKDMASVWNRPVSKIRKKMNKLSKDAAAGKKMGRRLVKFGLWIKKKGFNPDMASIVDGR